MVQFLKSSSSALTHRYLGQGALGGELDDYTLVRAQIDVAVHRLAGAITGGGLQQGPARRRRQARRQRVVAEIERDEYPLAVELADEEQQIATRDDRPVAAEHQCPSFPPQGDQPAVQAVDRSLVVLLRCDVFLV